MLHCVHYDEDGVLETLVEVGRKGLDDHEALFKSVLNNKKAAAWKQSPDSCLVVQLLQCSGYARVSSPGFG